MEAGAKSWPAASESWLSWAKAKLETPLAKPRNVTVNRTKSLGWDEARIPEAMKETSEVFTVPGSD